MSERWRPGKRATIIATLFAVALVLLPFLFWYDTWFGRTLNDRKLEEYLLDAKKPRRQQQALVQIGERLARGDRSVTRWYPQVVELSRHSNDELRQTAAWIMGQDRNHESFHEALKPMLNDASPMVRRNAALALAGFRDDAARRILSEMLSPSIVNAPAAGKVAFRLTQGQYANPGTLLARIGETEVRAQVPGEVRERLVADGSDVTIDDRLIDLGPDQGHVWEALRALYLIGTAEDLEAVQRYARPVAGWDDRVRQQASLTIRQIESRRGAAAVQ
jgi:biotin carboxyl carrier protein